ncbi:LPS-assembly protein LptD [Sphingosinicella sp. BN140058]|uniref:LPS-assembly protein LptD n=1 Tax=Sphingosinicella sp. BN140058 TaxID=1892855 RepID=UPI001012919F|nr:LPS assembly protein LptD [Sphingosinicella sp. BN140058]QAY79192.1 LPS-assembly protein LptD [Sphingosinicella sp. BN140058]
MKRPNLICLTALPLLLCAPAAALAQSSEAAGPPAPAELGTDSRQVAFSADTLAYDETNDVVTATGDVRMNSEGNKLRADRVVWTRTSDEVRAEGNVRLVTPEGDVAYGESIVLHDSMRDAVADHLLVVLEGGGRLAADRGERKDGYTTLYRAAYTPCAVTHPDGCPKNPTWQITAVRVVHDPYKKRIRYEGAGLNLFGTRIIALPGLSHPDGSGGGGSGLLVPDVRFSQSNGLEISTPYYLKIAPDKDATIAPHLYTDVLPMIEGHYRQLTSLGAFQVAGYLTYGSRIPIDDAAGVIDKDKGIRAYIEGNGRFQLDRDWSITASGRYVTDRTFLRRYDITRDTRLRSMVDIERIRDDSYISIAGWAFQGLRTTDNAGQQPVVLPAIDARFRLDDPIWDGKIELQANSLSILRTDGQDTQRAFAAAKWERRSLTDWGQELILTGYARGDVYHTSDVDLTQTALYRGERGWHARGIGAVAAELRWPLVGSFMGGTQRLTPRVQIVASPPTENLAIPNEDARAVDLEDSNLFALNRFPGYDRWEDGARITYGFDWGFDLPGVSTRTTIGQSYRLSEMESILPPGTGLSDRWSDIVGRTNVKVGHKLSFVHRFRLDKDSFELRRNEIDAVVGGHQTYATIGYLRLNRDIDPSIEDLRDREEIRLGGRIRFARYWSLFGSTVIDLTDAKEDPTSGADGYEPVRHRLGISYDDDCIEIGVTWRRDYDTTGDFRRGNTFLFRVALKNLGR